MRTILEDPLQTQIVYENPQVIRKRVENILKRHERQVDQKELKRRLAQQHRNRSRLLATAANERLMREEDRRAQLRKYKEEEEEMGDWGEKWVDSSPKKKSSPRRSPSRSHSRSPSRSPIRKSRTRRIWDRLTRGFRSRRTKKK